MVGFPRVPARNVFGPYYQNAQPPSRTPERNLNADEVNLTTWQVSQAGRTTPNAIGLLIQDPLAPADYLLDSFAWSLGTAQAFPTVVTNAGTPTITFPGVLLNERQEATRFVPRVVIVRRQYTSLAGLLAAVQDIPSVAIDGQAVTIQIEGAVADTSLFFAVWGESL